MAFSPWRLFVFLGERRAIAPPERQSYPADAANGKPGGTRGRCAACAFANGRNGLEIAATENCMRRLTRAKIALAVALCVLLQRGERKGTRFIKGLWIWW
jgi:hypothetical protein